MKIDKTIEPIVRDALWGVIKRDPDKVREALVTLPDDQASTKAGQLALAVALYAIHEIYSGRPSETQVLGLANKIAEMESWANVNAEELTTFLTAALDRLRLDKDLSLERVAYLIYIVAGSLVSAGRKEDEKWWDFLDRAEAAIEAEQS